MLSVGDAAARLGVSPSTLRMWGTRYGLLASASSAGGHRRYTEDDLTRLEQVHAAIVAGADPATAVRSVQPNGRAERPRPGPGGPGGTGLPMPGAGRTARGLARAAFRLDEMGVEDVVVEELRENGTISTWERVVRPVLVAAGAYWQRTGEGIEVEHLLTQAVTGAFVRHVAGLGEITRVDPVLLAGGPHEEHTLALHAVRAGLAERDVPARLLGPRTPMTALAAAAKRTRAPGVLIWLSAPDAVAAQELSLVNAAHRRISVHLGGPGWFDVDTGGAHVCADLSDAVDRLQGAWLARPGSSAAAAGDHHI